MQSGRNTAGLLLAMIFTISNLTPAYAHQPINLTAANSSANKGPIIVDGKVIKGILFDPTRQKTYQGVEAHIEFIISLIDEDIKRGRFIGLTEE